MQELSGIGKLSGSGEDGTAAAAAAADKIRMSGVLRLQNQPFGLRLCEIIQSFLLGQLGAAVFSNHLLGNPLQCQACLFEVGLATLMTEELSSLPAYTVLQRKWARRREDDLADVIIT